MKARGIWVIVFFSSALEVVAAKIAQDILHRIQNGKEAFGACEATGLLSDPASGSIFLHSCTAHGPIILSLG